MLKVISKSKRKKKKERRKRDKRKEKKKRKRRKRKEEKDKQKERTMRCLVDYIVHSNKYKNLSCIYVYVYEIRRKYGRLNEKPKKKDAQITIL